MPVPNKHNYGIHSLGFTDCPNCGSETEWYSMKRMNGKRCYRCAPIWVDILGPIALIAFILSLIVKMMEMMTGGGILGTGGIITSIALLLITQYPRLRH